MSKQKSPQLDSKSTRFSAECGEPTTDHHDLLLHLDATVCICSEGSKFGSAQAIEDVRKSQAATTTLYRLN